MFRAFFPLAGSLKHAAWNGPFESAPSGNGCRKAEAVKRGLMKRNMDEITEHLEAWLSEAIIRLHELEMTVQAEKAFIRRMLDLVKELRE